MKRRPVLKADENASAQVAVTRVALGDTFFASNPERLGRWVNYWWFAAFKKDPAHFFGTDADELKLAVECGWLIRSKGGRLRMTGPKKDRRWLLDAKRKWWTYAIEAVGQGLVKIGHTVDVERRLDELQCASPFDLRLLRAQPGDHEKRLHCELREHRVSGEWFVANEHVVGVLRREGLCL